MPATYENIATTTLTSAASTITFSSISGSYTDLRLVFVGVATSISTDIWLRFNSDTGTNYSNTFLYGDGTSALSDRTTGSSRINQGLIDLSTTIPCFSAIDIFSYAGSTNKTVLWSQSNDKNGSGAAEATVGLWRNTAAITTVTIQTSTSTFASGTTATLYGILRA